MMSDATSKVAISDFFQLPTIIFRSVESNSILEEEVEEEEKEDVDHAL